MSRYDPLHRRMGAGNRDPETWGGMEPCKFRIGQTWWQAKLYRGSIYHQSDRRIPDSNLWYFLATNAWIMCIIVYLCSARSVWTRRWFLWKTERSHENSQPFPYCGSQISQALFTKCTFHFGYQVRRWTLTPGKSTFGIVPHFHFIQLPLVSCVFHC